LSRPPPGNEAVYAARQEVQHFYKRAQPPSADFLVWNSQLRDSKRGLNFLQKSAKATRELGWIDSLTGQIADELERVLSVLTCADERSTFAVHVVVCLVSALASLALLVYSCAPFFFRAILLLAIWAQLAPPAIRDALSSVRTPAKTGSEPRGSGETPDASAVSRQLQVARAALAALWARIPTVDDLGHRAICAQQRVVLANHKPVAVSEQPIAI